MPTVELHVATELLAHYDIAAPVIGGRELGRSQDPGTADVTVITLDMDDAPEGAHRMDVMMERVLHKGTRIVSVTYLDADGAQLATIERPPDSGWFQQP